MTLLSRHAGRTAASRLLLSLTLSYCASVLAIVAPVVLPAGAAETKPATVRLDFIVGGKHAPWFVALEKGFYASRGLAVVIQPGTGSADAVRTLASGGADFVFADIPTTIVARSRGAAIVSVAQLGYVGATILWRDEGVIRGVKDLEGKSWAVSPGQAQWFLLPAYCRINKIDFKSIRILDTGAAHQPAALINKKADFIIQVRGSNDEVAEAAARKQGVKLKRVYMKDTGLDIYGSGLIVKESDVEHRSQLVSAYVEATMQGLAYTRRHTDEALQILLKQRPELDPALTAVQLKNALHEVMIPPESVQSGLGYMKPQVMEKTVRVTNEFFDVARKVPLKETFTNQFIKK